MERMFPGSYGVSAQERDDALSRGLVSFDANALLSLYRLSPPAREALLETMKLLGERNRLWFTYQALLEFHRHRGEVIRYQDERALRLVNHFRQLSKALKTELNRDPDHPFLELAALGQAAEKARASVEKTWQKAQRDRPEAGSDPVLTALTAIVGERCGREPSPEVRGQWEREAADRIARKVPPGFSDAEKIDGGHGDYLIWRELLDIAGREQRPIVFITDDTKEDWWELRRADDGSIKPIGPRAELVTEMHNFSGVTYVQLNRTGFQVYGRDALGVPTTDAVLEEIQRDAPSPYIVPRSAVSGAPSWADNGLGASLQGVTSFISPLEQIAKDQAQFQRAFQEGMAAAVLPAGDTYRQMIDAISSSGKIATDNLMPMVRAMQQLQEQTRERNELMRQAFSSALDPAQLIGAETRATIQALNDQINADLVKAATGGFTEATIKAAGGDLSGKLAQVSKAEIDAATGRGARDPAIDPHAGQD